MLVFRGVMEVFVEKPREKTRGVRSELWLQDVAGRSDVQQVTWQFQNLIFELHWGQRHCLIMAIIAIPIWTQTCFKFQNTKGGV